MISISITKLITVVLVLIGVYFILEEQFDVSFAGKKGEKGPSSASSRFLQSLTGHNLDDQLIEALMMISSSLKAGRNLDQAFELVAVSTPAPICNEFQTLVQERRLGVPMVEALGNLARRVPSQDLRLAVNATIFQQETGGNLEDLYRQIVLTVTERKKIMGKVIAGTAHARITGLFIGLAPLVMAGFVLTFQRDYIMPMIQNPYGAMILGGAILLAFVGIIIVNRLTSGVLPECEEVVSKINEAKEKGVKRWGLVRPILSLLGGIASSLPWMEKYRQDIRFVLDASGYTDDLSPDEFIGVKFTTSLLCFCLTIIAVNPLQHGGWGVVLLLPALYIGWHLPKIYLSHKIRQRQFNIEYDLPYIIDLLSLAIESGLDLVGGVQKIVEKSRRTDIVVEFQMLLADIKVGKSLEEAMSEMAERVQVLSFFSFVSSLIQAQRLGAEIGPTLRSQAEMMRYQRMILAEEKVNKLPVKLLLPLVFFIFPSLAVLLIGPAITKFLLSFPDAAHQTTEQIAR